MEHNIYQPPKSNVSNTISQKGSAIKAVLIAVCVDIIGTIVLGVLLAIVYGIILSAKGMPPEELEHTLSTLDTHSIFYWVSVTLGSAISVYAGYLCAKIANHKEYKIVGILGAISVAFGVLIGASFHSFMMNILLSILTLLCVYFGAWIHVRKKVTIQHK